MRPSLDRRQFLRAAGTVLALPALQSLGFKAFAAEKTPPKASAKSGSNPNFGMNMPMMSSAFDTSMWLNAA